MSESPAIKRKRMGLGEDGEMAEKLSAEIWTKILGHLEEFRDLASLERVSTVLRDKVKGFGWEKFTGIRFFHSQENPDILLLLLDMKGGRLSRKKLFKVDQMTTLNLLGSLLSRCRKLKKISLFFNENLNLEPWFDHFQETLTALCSQNEISITELHLECWSRSGHRPVYGCVEVDYLAQLILHFAPSLTSLRIKWLPLSLSPDVLNSDDYGLYQLSEAIAFCSRLQILSVYSVWEKTYQEFKEIHPPMDGLIQKQPVDGSRVFRNLLMNKPDLKVLKVNFRHKPDPQGLIEALISSGAKLDTFWFGDQEFKLCRIKFARLYYERVKALPEHPLMNVQSLFGFCPTDIPQWKFFPNLSTIIVHCYGRHFEIWSKIDHCRLDSWFRGYDRRFIPLVANLLHRYRYHQSPLKILVIDGYRSSFRRNIDRTNYLINYCDNIKINTINNLATLFSDPPPKELISILKQAVWSKVQEDFQEIFVEPLEFVHWLGHSISEKFPVSFSGYYSLTLGNATVIVCDNIISKHYFSRLVWRALRPFSYVSPVADMLEKKLIGLRDKV